MVPAAVIAPLTSEATEVGKLAKAVNTPMPGFGQFQALNGFPTVSAR